MSATTFKFDEKTNRLLEDLQRHYSASSKAEVLRKALAMLNLAAEAEDKGEHVVIESRDGSVKRQVLIR